MQAYTEPRLTHAEGRAQWLALFEEVKRQRLFAPAPSVALAKFALLAALLAASLWLAWFGSSWPTLGAGYAALALLLAQFAFIGHDAGHGGVGRAPAANRAFGQLAMTLVTGLAFGPIWPLSMAIGARDAGGSTMAALVTAGNSGAVVFPAAQGAILAGAGPGEGVAVTPLLCLLMFAVLLTHSRAAPRAPDTIEV